MTWFVGNFPNSSPEMKKLYLLKTSHYIDLYYNDLFGVLKSLDNIKIKINIIEKRIWS
jgi:hypothetical protein